MAYDDDGPGTDDCCEIISVIAKTLLGVVAGFAIMAAYFGVYFVWL